MSLFFGQLMKILLLALFFTLTSANAAPVSVYDSSSDFLAAVGGKAETEDWRSYAPDTVLDGQTYRGVTYNSTSNETLTVGSYHGAGWLLGYARGEGRYASFGYETLTFSFARPISAFGISLSQGNSSGAVSYDGESRWQLDFDAYDSDYVAIVKYSQADFTGEGYFGFVGSAGISKVLVNRIYSDANIVWDIRDISWVPAADIPEPSSISLFLTGSLVALSRYRRRKIPSQRSEQPC